MTQTRLLLLNGLRWWKENLWIWGILGSIYSLSLALLLETVIELTLKTEVKLITVFAGMSISLLVPAILHAVPLPSLPIPLGRPSGSELGSFIRLFLSHELRRSQNLCAVAFTVILLVSLPQTWLPLALALGQLPVQQSLFSVQRWRALALAHSPQQGARHLFIAFQFQQCLLGIAVLAGWVLTSLLMDRSIGPTLLYLPAIAGAWMGGASVLLEGASGRPWVVNFISLAAGMVAGFLTVLHWGFVFLIIYFCVQMAGNIKERLRSVELLDEDTLIS